MCQRKMILALVAIVILMFEFSSSASAQTGPDYSGRWVGRWQADATDRLPEHGGPLRVRLRSNGDGTYSGLFAGRFALVIPYIYRAPVMQNGTQLVSTKKLGPLGSYRMVLQGAPASLSGNWSAAGSTGSIRLRKR